MPGGIPPGRFESFYKCHSPGFIQRPDVEQGGKIILPPSALDTLTHLHIEYPMLFEIFNPATKRSTHCGVLEFVAEEGFCHIPYWMMQHLFVEEGQMIQIKSVSLPRGTHVKLQPHTTAFIDISNPRAVLENALRKFATLTKDEVIRISYNNKNYDLTVLETKPANAISIIETDIVLDFAAPLDYVEPTPTTSTPSTPTPTTSQTSSRASSAAQTIPKKTTEENPGPSPSSKTGSFKAFAGSGVRLDGKGSTPPAGSFPFGTTPPMGGGIVFGGRGAAPSKPSKTEDSDEEEEDEDKPVKKFVAFAGKGHSLK